jgi:hypothetical protein
MDAQRAAEELKVIRALMERPIRFSTMSGLSGIIAGAAALAGLAVDYPVWAEATDATLDHAMYTSGIIWGCVFVVALASVVLLTWRREKAQGMGRFWTPVKFRILRTILPPFLAGLGLTAAIVLRVWSAPSSDLWMLLAPLWMALYGLALWQVGQFSVPPIGAMGAAFIVAAVVSALSPGLAQNPVLTMGLTFGGFHIVYGVVVWVRYGG